jgi:hypothetical protein
MCRGIEEKDIKKINTLLRAGIEKTIYDTLAKVRKALAQSDILEAMLQIFCFDRDNIVAKSYEQYLKSQGYTHGCDYEDGDENEGLARKIFFRHKDKFYYRGNELADYMSGILHRNVTRNEIAKDLGGANLLSYSGAELSRRLPNKLENKVGDHQRYYCLNANALRDFVEGHYPDFLSRVNSPIKELRIHS